MTLLMENYSELFSGCVYMIFMLLLRLVDVLLGRHASDELSER